jgi:hypothetical protein
MDYKLRLGEVNQTQYIIPNRIEDNIALIDIIENALDLEFKHSGRRFALLDEFGRLSLRAEQQMMSPALINKHTCETLSFSSSVDNRSNRVKVLRFTGKSRGREIFVVRDETSENRIGVLQHYTKTTDQNANLGDVAKTLLAMKNRDARNLSVKNVLGCASVRGGSVVMLDFDDYKGNAKVNNCVHKFLGESHLMDLEIGF